MKRSASGVRSMTRNADHSKFTVMNNSQPAQGELSVLFSGEGKTVPGHGIGPAVHNYYLMHTVIEGCGTFQINGNHYTCSRGDTFIIFPEELFAYNADDRDPWHYVWVAFKGQSAAHLLLSLGFSAANPIVHADDIRPLVSLYRKIRGTLELTTYPELADLEAGGYMRVLLKELGLRNEAQLAFNTQSNLPDIERQIKRAMRWLSYQYAQPISIEKLSSSLGYHRTHLSKMFKQMTGLSPMQFLLRVRMERAKELLIQQFHLSVDQVASSVGYPDALYFSKQFRKMFGCSPSQYRAKSKHESG